MRRISDLTISQTNGQIADPDKETRGECESTKKVSSQEEGDLAVHSDF